MNIIVAYATKTFAMRMSTINMAALLTVPNSQQGDASYAGWEPELVCQQVQRGDKEVVRLSVEHANTCQ